MSGICEQCDRTTLKAPCLATHIPLYHKHITISTDEPLSIHWALVPWTFLQIHHFVRGISQCECASSLLKESELSGPILTYTATCTILYHSLYHTVLPHLPDGLTGPQLTWIWTGSQGFRSPIGLGCCLFRDWSGSRWQGVSILSIFRDLLMCTQICGVRDCT